MNLKIPEKVNQKTKKSFSSLGFHFKIELCRISIKEKGMGIVNARLFVNDEFTNAIDFTDWFIIDKHYLVVMKIIQSVFNQKFSGYILKNLS